MVRCTSKFIVQLHVVELRDEFQFDGDVPKMLKWDELDMFALKTFTVSEETSYLCKTGKTPLMKREAKTETFIRADDTKVSVRSVVSAAVNAKITDGNGVWVSKWTNFRRSHG